MSFDHYLGLQLEQSASRRMLSLDEIMVDLNNFERIALVSIYTKKLRTFSVSLDC